MKRGNEMMNSNIAKGLLNMGQKKSEKSQTWSVNGHRKVNHMVE